MDQEGEARNRGVTWRYGDNLFRVVFGIERDWPFSVPIKRLHLPSEVVLGFRCMKQAMHIGKIVFSARTSQKDVGSRSFAASALDGVFEHRRYDDLGVASLAVEQLHHLCLGHIVEAFAVRGAATKVKHVHQR